MPPISRFCQHRERASTLVIVLLVIAFLSVVAGNLLWSATSRYHTTYQSASWEEALVAAEAGVNLAMAELRKRVKAGNNAAFQSPWLAGNPSAPAGGPVDKRLLGGAVDPATASAYYDPVTDPSMTHAISLTPSYPENGHALPLRAIATHGGEGNGQMWVRVYVDVPGSLPSPSNGGTNFATRPTTTIDDFMNEQSDGVGYDSRTYWWYRIRSMGITGLSGPPRANTDNRDNLLRRFSFFTDWRSNLPVNTAGPQVSRLVEAVVKPQTGFRNAIMADLRIDLNDQSVLIDSYNSSYGLYGATYTQNGQSVMNLGTMGNIATNGTLINAGGAVVKGDAMTDDGSVKNAQNVSGDQRTDFYQELTKVPAPVSGTPNNFVLDGKTLNGKPGAGTSGAITFDGSGKYKVATSTDRNNPTRVYVNGIDLTNGPSSVELTVPASGASSYVKLIVNGDIKVNDPQKTDGSNAIIVDNGVHAIIYVTGDVLLQGAGISNIAQASDRLLINGVQPANPTGASQKIQIKSTQDFQGIIYAPDADVTLSLQAVPASPAGPAAPPTPPAPGTPPTGPIGSLPKAVQDQIKKLQKQIDDLNKDTDNQNKDIQKQQDDMVKNPQHVIQDMLKIAADQAKISANQSQAAALQNQLNTLSGNIVPDTDPQAADHASGYNGIYGSFVGRTISVGSKTHVHYDEALRQAGPVNHYTITNWLEDNASHTSN